MKKILTILFIISSFILLTSCKKEAVDDNKITIGIMPSLAFVPYIYALEEGYYDDLGMEVELIVFHKATQRDAALKGETLDAVSTDFVAVGLYLEQNINMVVTAKVEEEFRLVKSANYQVDTISETNKARVGISENTVVEYLIDKVSEKNNISFEKIGIPSVPNRAAALGVNVNGITTEENIDMAIMPEPFPTLAINGGGAELWKNRNDNISVTCLAFKYDFFKKHEQELIKFHKATDEAINSLKNANYEDYKQFIVKHNILTEQSVNLVAEQKFDNLTTPSSTQFQDVMSWMKDKNLIKTEYTLEDILFDWKK